MKAKPTPGPWKASFSGPICIGVQNGDFYGQIICNSILPETDEDYEKEKGEIEANINLIAEAGTVYHETGLTPRELKEAISTQLQIIKSLSSGKRVVNLDEAIAHYESILK